MAETADFLRIAGTTRRTLMALEVEANEHIGTFPKGPDEVHVHQQIAICESIISLSRALLATHLFELSFTVDGRAEASAPAALRGTEWDNGTEEEPKD